MTEAFKQAENEMRDQGYDINAIPQEVHEQHLWAEGLLLWWHHRGQLPTPFELAEDMLDEWDDPVSEEEAEAVLKLLKGT